uniref:Protein kinase domain-containing protein n=1 Tax=Chromera velia CCMP2878 TaxID=1169474 RepID=A0A0G4FKU3_9ALVE|eukprot:Cvel_3460.t1-p1 / transcript=Cvel_3460.t1 / gene=Cvel_3460 / organism=Chromera_velia_CCMP2878 / gene_product=Mitogen-activated protein kinase 5, putative / transcript_product=Mitogen-activated protein kinase 5, putative / location=Cvel_scaffold139:100809-105012(-) / protein_length=628 / sequence_SO=supercontig / SO=protein_coding / is_pseudo=false
MSGCRSDERTRALFQSEESLKRRYTYLARAGAGAYGSVMVAKDMAFDRLVAIKHVPDVLRSENFAKCILREVKILRRLRGHENLLDLQGLEIIPKPDGKHDAFLITGLMETDMAKVIRSGQTLSLHHCQFFLYQILRGVKYLHTANIMHRDLKPANLLLNCDCDLRICDLGLARVMPDQQQELSVPVELQQQVQQLQQQGGAVGAGEPVVPLTEYVQTRWYRAPEVLCGQGTYGSSVDIWSTACIAVEMVIGQPLFRGRDLKDQLTQVVRFLGKPTASDMLHLRHPGVARFIERLEHAPPRLTPQRLQSMLPGEAGQDPAFADLVCRMFSWNPRDRPTAAEALSHEFFAELHREDDEPEGIPMHPSATAIFERRDHRATQQQQQQQRGGGPMTVPATAVTAGVPPSRVNPAVNPRGDERGERPAEASTVRSDLLIDEFLHEVRLVRDMLNRENGTPSTAVSSSSDGVELDEEEDMSPPSLMRRVSAASAGAASMAPPPHSVPLQRHVTDGQVQRGMAMGGQRHVYVYVCACCFLSLSGVADEFLHEVRLVRDMLNRENGTPSTAVSSSSDGVELDEEEDMSPPSLMRRVSAASAGAASMAPPPHSVPLQRHVTDGQVQRGMAMGGQRQ